MSGLNEAKTRKELIDPALERAGWDINNSDQVGIEIPVDGFDPRAWEALKKKIREQGGTYELPAGISDYALYRSNGEIIAIVEAKRTSVDPRLAQTQAEFYVSQIERRQSFRPFAFMTNGGRGSHTVIATNRLTVQIMNDYLIYHPPRSLSLFDDTKVYHDRIKRGNQDPYIWNKQFLHTYCHITQMRFTKGDINFWVSGDTFPDFSHLRCDLVFVVQDICPWKERNQIDCTDPIIDSTEAFIDHYQWPEQGEHRFKRRRRCTLKADPERSFQPQNANQELIDIVPFLVSAGLSLETLHQRLRAHPTANRGSKPFLLEEWIPISLYDWLEKEAPIKLKGDYLQQFRLQHPERLSSDRPRR